MTSNVVLFPGIKLTPQMCLVDGMSRDDMDAVVLVYFTEKKEIKIGWGGNVRDCDLASAAIVLTTIAAQRLTEPDDEAVTPSEA